MNMKHLKDHGVYIGFYREHGFVYGIPNGQFDPVTREKRFSFYGLHNGKINHIRKDQLHTLFTEEVLTAG
ncbi:hypothetical protein SAMN02799624_05252 [Paenibacillus sp. UNC496MF]|uniref:hypothetical protein n=1 Tax=Paenibacillus sp. UNC496MF TaxID=1502753 RepID=UPI0008E2DB56|nr:hypothetical protein [Paenibacillus sp. UNC496MF]SFJ62915.1 hypothetical protein SAMN02799624_05252 [Paenibacillus sp. UNC496MF]